MANSCLGPSGNSYQFHHEQDWLIESTDRQQGWHVPFTWVVPLLLVMTAVLFVPEKPHQLASICERHNPVVACQVW